MKLLLNSKKGKRSTNKDNFLRVGLENQMKKISNHDGQYLVDIYQTYLDEKDASDKYRLIFTLNPICTNALFNAITEVVYKEGSPDCTCPSNSSGETPNRISYPNIISDQPISRIQAIRDTEYSNERIYGLTYLPGIDLFNNHLARQNGLNCIMKRTNNSGNKYDMVYGLSGGTIVGKDELDVFNTIRDYQRTQEGKEIIRKFPGPDATYLNPVTGQPHVYQESEILDFDTTIKSKLKEKNGWFGFYNPSTLTIPAAKDEDGSDIYINKLLNNRNVCDFVEMFPDRTRYTFVPQRNKYRGNRLEKNWKYCLTYPYSSIDYLIDDKGEPVVENGKLKHNPIVAEEDGDGNVRNGLRFCVVDEYITDGDKRRVLIQSPNSVHNLQPKDTINIYYKVNEQGEYDEKGSFIGIFNVQVKSVGDSNGALQQYYFSVDADDVWDWFTEESGLAKSQEIDADGNLKDGITGRFCRTVLGIESMYYFRVFRRVPNFKEISEGEDKAYYISKYNKPKYDFNSEINKLAFATNIYGDNMVQILYLDDIDVNGLTDNLERPVSDIYLTIVKANDGHEEWYPTESGTTPNYGDEKITIARAFGKVTSGIDLPPEPGFMKDYNVHRIHNIDFNKICEEYEHAWDEINDAVVRPYENIGNIFRNYNILKEHPSGETVCERYDLGLLNTLENDITADREFFLGDMVEFVLPRYEEIILEPVYHRFNTAQREYINQDYRDILTDEIYMDDYEGSETGVTQNSGNSISGNFKCVEDFYNQGYENIETEEGAKKQLVLYPGNLFPEGYYYQPHYRIHLKDISEKISQSSDTQVELTADGVDTGETGNIVTFTTARDYDIIAKDEIVIQDSKNNIFYDAIVASVTGITGETRVEAALKDGVRINEGVPSGETPTHFLVFKKTLGIPKYAIHYPDTSGKYIWRGLVPPSKVSTSSEIYDKPFTNGAHYRHLGINFFLRRQDPFGYYELNTKNEMSTGETNKLTNFMVPGRLNENIYYNDIIIPGIIDIC